MVNRCAHLPKFEDMWPVLRMDGESARSTMEIHLHGSLDLHGMFDGDLGVLDLFELVVVIPIKVL